MTRPRDTGCWWLTAIACANAVALTLGAML